LSREAERRGVGLNHVLTPYTVSPLEIHSPPANRDILERPAGPVSGSSGTTSILPPSSSRSLTAA